MDHITTHSNPTYEKHGVVHYSFANMPGAVARTSTLALTNVAVPYGVQIVNKGYPRVASETSATAKGINLVDGTVTYKAEAEAHGYTHTNIETILEKEMITIS